MNLNEKIEELKALLEQDIKNLTEYGKERIQLLKKELFSDNQNESL
jgi:hypothetical protein